MSSGTPQTFSVRCRVLRRHQWVRHSTEDGSRYLSCARCGRDVFVSALILEPDLSRGF